jgi:hypothetical protein
MTPETPPAPPPTNPRWVKITVIALIAFVWIAAVVTIVRGGSWVEAVSTALIATLCLFAVDLGIDLGRRRKS